MEARPAKKAGDSAGKRKGASPNPPAHSPIPPMPMTPVHRESHDSQINLLSDWSSSPTARSRTVPVNRNSSIDVLCAAVRDLSISPRRPSGVPPLGDSTRRPQESRLPYRPSPPKPDPSSVAVSPSASIASSFRSSRRTPTKVKRYLTRYSHVQGWDQDEREENLEAVLGRFMHQLKDTTSHSVGLQEALELYKSQGMSDPSIGSIPRLTEWT